MSSVYHLIISKKEWVTMELVEHVFLYKNLVTCFKKFDMSQMNGVMDVIAVHLKKEDELPSLYLLQLAVDLIELIKSEVGTLVDGEQIKNNWPVNFRIVTRRLLQTPAISYGRTNAAEHPFIDSYLPTLFELCEGLISLIGYKWFESDRDFLLLLATVSSTRLQNIFHDGKTNVKEAFIHGSLQCHFMRFIEDERNFLLDSKGAVLCSAVHEAAMHTCIYYQSCDNELAYSEELVLATFHFLCMFLSYGGYDILLPKYVQGLGRILLTLAVKCCEHSLIPLECLSNVVCKIPCLPKTTVDTIVEALKLRMDSVENRETVIKILRVLVAFMKVHTHHSIGSCYTEESYRKTLALLKSLDSEV